VASKLSLFLAELKRRKVYRVAAVYVAVGVAISLGVPDLFSVFDLPSSAARMVIILIVIGFPIALVLAWAYEVKPEEPRPSEPASAAVVAAPDSEQRKSIVVLPFDNMSPDPGDAYFSDGLTEEITTHLSHIHALRVISRNSAMVLKGTPKDTRTIANELQVQYVLEGSVRKAGDALRITAQLIDATSDEHLWAEKYDGVLEDVFDVQEQVSQSIADALQLQLTPEEKRRIGERPLENPAAYECYLRAKTSSFEFSEEAIQRAIQHLDHGLQIIGDNALLFAGMAFAHAQLVNVGASQEESLAKAHEFAEKALALDPQCADAYVALAWTVMLEHDIPGMIRHSKRALDIDPNNIVALATLGSGYVYIGKIPTAVPVLDRLKQLDPIAFQTHWTQGALAFYDGRFERAVRLWRALYERYRSAAYAPYSYAVALFYIGESEAASEVVDENAAAHPGNAATRVGMVLKHAAKGDKSGVYAQMSPDFIKTLERDYSFAHHVAGAFALLGDTDEALKWVETSVAAGFINYPMLADHDPFLGSIRSDPRFVRLMERVKHEWETFEF